MHFCAKVWQNQGFEKDKIIEYINNGGEILLLMGPDITGKNLTNFQEILNQYEINRRDLEPLIRDIHKRKPSYGYHRINAVIKRETGWVVSDNLVYKVCKILKNMV